MKRTKKEYIEAKRIFIDFWQHYVEHPITEDAHAWFDRHAQPITCRKHQYIIRDEDTERFGLFVCSGLIGQLDTLPQYAHRRFLYIAQPLDFLLTVSNVYSQTPLYHPLVALRSSLVIRFSTLSLRWLKEHLNEGNTLIHVTRERYIKRLRIINQLKLIPNEVDRYIQFYQEMRELVLLTTQEEQAHYLNISRSSITRALRKL